MTLDSIRNSCDVSILETVIQTAHVAAYTYAYKDANYASIANPFSPASTTLTLTKASELTSICHIFLLEWALYKN